MVKGSFPGKAVYRFCQSWAHSSTSMMGPALAEAFPGNEPLTMALERVGGETSVLEQAQASNPEGRTGGT
eukprot:8405744-Pyramimonas_sp.AAC.1